MDTYRMDQIDILEVVSTATGVAITFSPMLETAWHCPGLVVDDLGEETYVSLVRCGLKEKCAVTHPIDPASPRPWTVMIDRPLESIRIKDDLGLHRLTER